jgi:tRNA(Ile2) C34 agmatinyltransferase TiaS
MVKGPHCYRCGSVMKVHQYKGHVIAWECLKCGKRVVIERGAYKHR